VDVYLPRIDILSILGEEQVSCFEGTLFQYLRPGLIEKKKSVEITKAKNMQPQENLTKTLLVKSLESLMIKEFPPMK